MKRLLCALFVGVFALSAMAQSFVGVQLFDMYKTEEVYLMTSAEFRELQADLREEKSVFNRAVSIVKKDWDKQYAAARKAGDKLFPKYPTKAFVWVRSVKSKNFSNKKSADEWYAKQKGRVNAKMAEQAAAIVAANKAAKGGATAGYSSKEDKKAREKADKKALEEAVKEKLAEEVELQMANLLKYNRPVPRHFIVDPVAGAEKTLAKQIAKQEEALKAYKERKAAAEAATAETEE